MTHGVIVNEKSTSLAAAVASDSAIQVAVGTAPISLTKQPLINQPVMAMNYSEAVEKLGWSANFKDYTLCQVMSASFQVFGVRPVVFINVLNPAIHKAVVAESAMSMLNKQVVISEEVAGKRKNIFGVLLESITVKSEEGSTAYVCGTDYATAFDDSGFAVISIMPGGSIPVDAQALKVGCSRLAPEAVTEEDIIGGYTAATGVYKGIECISQVYPKLGLNAGILTAPGWSQKPAVAMALAAKCSALNSVFKCVTFVDIDSSNDAAPTYDKVKAWKDKNSYTDIWMYALWLKGVVGKQVYYLSALAAALMAETDAANNGVPARSPSNKALRITGLVNEAGDEVNLDVEQANYINSCGVATALNMGGWKLWGNTTAAYPENTDPKDFWLNYRRLFAWDSNNTVLAFAGDVDEPISQRLIQAIVDTKNLQGNGYVAAGNLAAYRCEYQATQNQITDIIGGKVQFNLSLSPYPPAQTIVFTQEFDPMALEAALSGGGA